MLPSSPSQVLRQAKVPALLISDLVNIRYLTGAEISSGLILIKPTKYHLFTDARYLEAVSKRPKTHLRIHGISKLEKALENTRRCGIESEAVTVATLEKWKRKYKSTKFVHTKGVLAHFRRTKEEDEIRKFKRAQRITREIIRRVPSVLRKGITERALAWKLEVWARELGADSLAFDPIVAFGSHTSRPHHKPTDRKLTKGHLVQVDVGAKFNGYCADQSMIFFTKEPTTFQQKVLVALEDARDQVTETIEPGITNHALDKLARKTLSSYGLEEYFTHALGHGLGLEIHEGVSLSQKSPRKKLLANEVITIEPGVYIPGKFGMRLEEEVVVR